MLVKNEIVRKTISGKITIEFTPEEMAHLTILGGLLSGASGPFRTTMNKFFFEGIKIFGVKNISTIPEAGVIKYNISEEDIKIMTDDLFSGTCSGR